MNKKLLAIFFAILAAGLYAINIPLSKLLLNHIEPMMMASYLYLGAGISTGMFISIVLKSTPLAGEVWGLSNQMTARALESIGKNGGPRCCKRDSYLAIIEAVKFTSEKLHIDMKQSPVICTRSHLNNQCRQEKCPFHKDYVE